MFDLRARAQRSGADAQAPDCCPELCAFCKVSFGGKMIPCDACQSVFYCSARHMEAHRFKHKFDCRQLQEKRQAQTEVHQRPPRGRAGSVVEALSGLQDTGAAEPRAQSAAPGRPNPQTPPPHMFQTLPSMTGAPGSRPPVARTTGYQRPAPLTGARPLATPSSFRDPPLELTADPRNPGDVLQRSPPEPEALQRDATWAFRGAARGAAWDALKQRGQGQGQGQGPQSGRRLGPGPDAPPDALHDEDQYVAELGRASWKVLHAMADRYPQFPSREESQAAVQFLKSFAMLYPCEKCRLHFKALLKKYPPDVRSRDQFRAWMGHFHDQVNLTLNKPVFGPS